MMLVEPVNPLWSKSNIDFRHCCIVFAELQGGSDQGRNQVDFWTRVNVVASLVALTGNPLGV
jgi:hypothetical protein